MARQVDGRDHPRDRRSRLDDLTDGLLRGGLVSIYTWVRFAWPPLPAGAKDPGIIRFAHAVQQENVPRAYSKDLDGKPVTEVRLTDGQQSVVQLWQKGAPWPVYVRHGRTQAWLVSADRSS